MTWPIPTLPTNRTNATDQLDTHPADHNALADAINELAARGGVESGSYTPTLTALVAGSGGTNTASYLFLGAAPVGSRGLLIAYGNITFGSSGQTFPSNASRIALPAGFNFAGTASLTPIGSVNASDAGVSTYAGTIVPAGVAAFTWHHYNTAGSFANLQAPTPTTIPFPWGSADFVDWSLIAQAVRV